MKSYINHFNEMSNFMMWSPDVRVLAHLTNGVLPETPFWDELQQKECRSVSEFYRKASKFLKLKDSKEALRKAEGAIASNKNDLGEAPDNKSKDKQRREDKWVKSVKKQKNGQKPSPKVYQLPFSHCPSRPYLCGDRLRPIQISRTHQRR